jgi:hypothetical protein
MTAGFSCHLICNAMAGGSLGTSQVKRQSLRAAQGNPQKVAATHWGLRNKHYIPRQRIRRHRFRRGSSESETWTSSELVETKTRGRVTPTCSSSLAAAAIFRRPIKLGSGTRICFYFQGVVTVGKWFLAVPQVRCIPEGFERSSGQVLSCSPRHNFLLGLGSSL